MDDWKKSGNYFLQETGNKVLENTDAELTKDGQQFAAGYSAEKIMSWSAATSLQ